MAHQWTVSEDTVLVHFLSHDINYAAVERLLILKAPRAIPYAPISMAERVQQLNGIEEAQGKPSLTIVIDHQAGGKTWADRKIVDDWLVKQVSDHQGFKSLIGLGDKDLDALKADGLALDDGTVAKLTDETDDLLELHLRRTSDRLFAETDELIAELG